MWTVRDRGGDLVTSDGKPANSVTRRAAYDRTVNTMSSASFPPAAAMKHDGLTGPKPWMWHITSCYSWARRLSHLTLWKVCISLLVRPDELQLSELERGGEGTRAGWGRQREVCRPTAIWITGDSPHRCLIIDAPSTWASTSIHYHHHRRKKATGPQTVPDPPPQPRGALPGRAC